MFGPNQHIEYKVKITGSHRDSDFMYKYSKLVDIFKYKFNLDDYDILFLGGGGTLGIESIFFSTKKDINVIGNDGIFKEKWRQLSKVYNKKTNIFEDLFCRLETSNSTSFSKSGCIVDGVSSFPFYDIPEESKIFVTCSNKQLGSLVGLSIVFVRKDYWQELIEYDVFSYLNLARYKQFQKNMQTPSTIPTYIFDHLIDVMESYDQESAKDLICSNSSLICDKINKCHIVGDSISPVITIKKEGINKNLAEKYQLYGVNSESDCYQIFTYNPNGNFLKNFISEL